MKKYLHLTAIVAVFGIGAVLGGSALSTRAQSTGWTPPQQPPPDGNVAAPINVGSSWQSKIGQLTLGSNTKITPNTPLLDVQGSGLFSSLGITGNLIIAQGAGANKVLTSNADGLASWQTPTTGGGTTEGSSLISGWPDAIVCTSPTDSSTKQVLYLNHVSDVGSTQNGSTARRTTYTALADVLSKHTTLQYRTDNGNYLDYDNQTDAAEGALNSCMFNILTQANTTSAPNFKKFNFAN